MAFTPPSKSPSVYGEGGGVAAGWGKNSLKCFTEGPGYNTVTPNPITPAGASGLR